MKNLLCQGAVPIGTMVIAMRNPAMAWILKAAGFDFFILDCEHGSFSYETVEDMMMAARGAGIAGLVRVPGVSREAVLKCVEAGAEGLLVPQVETRESVEQVLEFMKYAPAGRRGVSLTRAHTGWTKAPKQAYMAEANGRTLLMAQIESRLGVENIEAILATPGIDCVLIGPNDLSQSLTDGRNDDAEGVADAIRVVIAAAKDAGVPFGTHYSDLAATLKWKAEGAGFVMWSSDVDLILGSAQQGLGVLRK